ncbi:MAG: (2Fe-2S) ferredoxin domain-containing protein [Spirochaetia bacterium]|nr:(2Fe-2S) ferredoxin domain-containing protein [Spirochaetia bacterium]
MDKMKKGDLSKFRKEYKKLSGSEIVISMGTCGIAAGGDRVYKIIEKDLNDNGIKNVIIKKTGCLGLCFCEPNIIVRMEGMPEVLYGNVDEKTAHMIISEHVIKKNIVNNYVIFMPTNDIGKNIFKDQGR